MMGGQQSYTFAPGKPYSERCFHFCDIQQHWQASSISPCTSTPTHYLSGGDKKQNKMDFLSLPLGSVQMAENGTKWSAVKREWVQCKKFFQLTVKLSVFWARVKGRFLRGKERKEEAFHLSESMDRLFPLILIYWILAGEHVTFNWKENKCDQILNYGPAWWLRIAKSTSTLGTCIWDAQAK